MCGGTPPGQGPWSTATCPPSTSSCFHHGPYAQSCPKMVKRQKPRETEIQPTYYPLNTLSFLSLLAGVFIRLLIMSET